MFTCLGFMLIVLCSILLFMSAKTAYVTYQDGDDICILLTFAAFLLSIVIFFVGSGIHYSYSAQQVINVTEKSHTVHTINGIDFIANFLPNSDMPYRLININAEFSQDFQDGQKINIITTKYKKGLYSWNEDTLKTNQENFEQNP